MKKILIQLDTDPHPSPFDAIAAYDADVNVVLGFGEITPDNLADIVQGAIFPRGPDGQPDAEWAQRVAIHRARRPGWWRTVESLDIAGILRAEQQDPVLRVGHE